MTGSQVSHAELLSMGIVAGTAVVITVLERKFPYAGGQRLFRRGFLGDVVWYSILFNYVMGLWIFGWVIPGLDRWTGVSRLHLLAGWPVWVQCAGFLLLHDLYIYWFHRWQHSSPWLWRLHELHHSATDIDWAAGSRTHALETLINQTVEYAPIVLLGAAPQVALFKGIIDAVWGMFIHSNIDVRLGRLQWIINGPEMHRWHHAREKHNINFATKCAFWDFLFRTAYRPAKKPRGYGLDIEFPSNIVLHQLFAFRSGRRDKPRGEATAAEGASVKPSLSEPALRQ